MAAPSPRRGNVISGNTVDGIEITGSGTSGNLVEGNFIGTNAAGTAAVGNASFGIQVHNGAANTTIGGFTATPGTGAGNVISGNQVGIDIGKAAGETAQPNGATILGNLIGTNAAGTAALGNAAAGIAVGSATNVAIGGDDAADGTVDSVVQARNVISGTTESSAGTNVPFAFNGGPGEGIYVSGAGAGVAIEGNYVGTDVTGTTTLANGSTGVDLNFNLAQVTVGGATAARAT